MQRQFELVIVIPVGPTCKIEYILDTIESIYFYVHCDFKIILSDDSQNTNVRVKVKEQYPDAVIISYDTNQGKTLGLYMTLCKAYRYALEHFDFKVLLRLDTDALIIGHDPEAPILEFFEKNPSVGLAGRYVKRVYSPDDFGNVWHNGGREHMVAIAKMFTRYYLRHPFINWKIRKLMFSAINQGYELGELIFGGSYAFSRLAIEKLDQKGLLPWHKVRGADMEEDHFFTLLVASTGLELGDLASGDQPFACTWRGLPASPETLYEANKKIIHSTRFWKNLNEDQIRDYFRSKRRVLNASNLNADTTYPQIEA